MCIYSAFWAGRGREGGKEREREGGPLEEYLMAVSARATELLSRKTWS